jgi:hypothetical protein
MCDRSNLLNRDERPKHKCAFDGCPARSEQPYTDGWASLSDWGPGIKDGFYCKAHAAALEEMLMDGSFQEIQEAKSQSSAS